MDGRMKNNIATLSNNVLTSCYELSMVELRLIFQFISLINNHKKQREKEIDVNKYYSISVEDYAELYGVPLKVAKREVDNAVGNLYDRNFIYTDMEENIIKTRWVSSIKYNKDSHTVELAWALGILPHINNLQSNFTSYKMKYIAELPSAYSFRWYTLFLMELNRNSRNLHFRELRAKGKKQEVKPLEVTYSIEDIRKMFVLEDKYPLIVDLKKRVIEGPIKNMVDNPQCNISIIGIAYIKSGKTITGVCFSIKFTLSETQEKFNESVEKCKEERQRRFGKNII